jgi:hypothetical protein
VYCERGKQKWRAKKNKKRKKGNRGRKKVFPLSRGLCRYSIKVQANGIYVPIISDETLKLSAEKVDDGGSISNLSKLIPRCMIKYLKRKFQQKKNVFLLTRCN